MIFELHDERYHHHLGYKIVNKSYSNRNGNKRFGLFSDFKNSNNNVGRIIKRWRNLSNGC